MIIIAALVIIVNIITEVIKIAFELKSAKAINIFVIILSIAITIAVFMAYWQIRQLTITWYFIVTFIIIGFAVAYASMLGYDKLLSNLEIFKKIRGITKGNTE